MFYDYVSVLQKSATETDMSRGRFIRYSWVSFNLLFQYIEYVWKKCDEQKAKNQKT